jgi:hypothetical protein
MVDLLLQEAISVLCRRARERKQQALGAHPGFRTIA